MFTLSNVGFGNNDQELSIIGSSRLISSPKRHVARVKLLVLESPLPQALNATTLTEPAEAPQVTVIFAVPCPDVMIAPVGTVQVN